MGLHDQSAEYYRLREGHERALALAARTRNERNRHLIAASRFAVLARGTTDMVRTTGS